MNYFHQPNLLLQFWAGVHTEFDKLVSDFVRSDGWLFPDLCRAAQRADLGSIFRCASTSVHLRAAGMGQRLEHWARVNVIILDAAKTAWLLPWRKFVVDPSGGVIPPFLKRQLGGFFLLYLLHSGQPLSYRSVRKQKVLMDSRDLLAMHVFIATIQKLPKGANPEFKELGRQIVVMFNDLVRTEAFQFSVIGDEYGSTVNMGMRRLLSAKFCELTGLLYKLKDVRDQLEYITHGEGLRVFQSLVAVGKLLPKKRKETQTDRKLFDISKESWTVEEIAGLQAEDDLGVLAHSISNILLKSLLQFPRVTTPERLTGVNQVFLDKELSDCVKLHQGQLRSFEYNNNNKKGGGGKGRVGEEQLKKVRLTVWRDYLSQDYGWIDKVFAGEMGGSTGSGPRKKQDEEDDQGGGGGGTHNVNVKQEVYNMEVEEDDGEWESVDENDEDNDDDDHDDDYDFSTTNDRLGMMGTAPRTRTFSLDLDPPLGGSTNDNYTENVEEGMKEGPGKKTKLAFLSMPTFQ